MSRRPYDSSRRRQAAAAGRLAMLDAARRLFIERGYAGTTVADIAELAGVAPATVNAAFGGKAGLLKRLVDIAIAGDDEPVPVSERPIVQEIASQAGDPRRQVDLLVALLAETHARLADLHDVLAQASGVDEQAREEVVGFEQRRRVGMGEFVALVSPDALVVDQETAADAVWALTEPRLFVGLVRERGWSAEQYRAWVSQQICAAILKPEIAG